MRNQKCDLAPSASDAGRSDDQVAGIVRNNFFHRGSAQSGDVGITINNSAATKVLNNTVVLSGTYPNAIEYDSRPRPGSRSASISPTPRYSSGTAPPASSRAT